MTTSPPPPVPRVVGEFVGTAFLLMAVVGSGVMAEQLTEDPGLQLLQNAIATGAMLTALILAFVAVSGAHFNPIVTLAAWALGGADRRIVPLYLAAQVAGAVVGTIMANVMFGRPTFEWATNERDEPRLVFAEVIAALGLLLVIFLVVRAPDRDRSAAPEVAIAVGTYIAGAYYFTSSTSFANPAVTIGRMFSDSFAGIEPSAVPAYIGAQLVAVPIAIALINTLVPD